MNKNKWLIAFCVFVFVVLIGATLYMFNYSLLANPLRYNETEYSFKVMKKRYPHLQTWIDSIRNNKVLKDTFIEMSEKEQAHAFYMYASKPTNRTAILVHGYKECGIKMLHIAHLYACLGFNVLIPDLHGHGLSDGKYIQMGWKDRLDVLRWCAFANQLFKLKGKNSQQVLHGISMGAATVMGVSGENTPSFIRCFVEDCGYTSVWDEFKGELKNRFSLPSFPLLYTTSVATKVFCGWSFQEASPLNAVSKCKKPMLFIHGNVDFFVPTAMVYRLYKAKPQPKRLWVVPQAAHAESYKVNPDKYKKQVEMFLQLYF